MTGNTVTAGVANNPGSKVAEMRMMLSTDANKGKRIVLVEGGDDRKFYKRFVSDSHIVINVLEGCFYMPDILTMSNQSTTLKDRVIGIKDADFDHIIGEQYGLDNLFTTDTHDWETMVMTSECEKNVAIEALDRKEDCLFEQVMEDLTNYSYIKLYNTVEVCGKGLDGILFKGFTLSNIYDGSTPCTIDVALNAVKSHGNNARLAHFPKEEDIAQIKQSFQKLDYKQLTCGHDVIHGVVYRLTHLRGCSPTIGYSDIEMLFRTSCTNDFFKTTNLYRQVEAWSRMHNTVVWAA